MLIIISSQLEPIRITEGQRAISRHDRLGGFAVFSENERNSNKIDTFGIVLSLIVMESWITLNYPYNPSCVTDHDALRVVVMVQPLSERKAGKKSSVVAISHRHMEMP